MRRIDEKELRILTVFFVSEKRGNFSNEYRLAEPYGIDLNPRTNIDLLASRTYLNFLFGIVVYLLKILTLY